MSLTEARSARFEDDDLEGRPNCFDNASESIDPNNSHLRAIGHTAVYIDERNGNLLVDPSSVMMTPPDYERDPVVVCRAFAVALTQKLEASPPGEMTPQSVWEAAAKVLERYVKPENAH